MNFDELKKVEEMVDDCEQAVSCQNNNFTKWEQDFVGSIIEQFKSRRDLSPKQVEILERIWNKI